mmetsp:Transcript_27875/g.85069  ORF Transcript_27875/g.85069 Transcript_27875/m.85069 type:complete len:99 (+) Transcript_27875:261-557(+)
MAQPAHIDSVPLPIGGGAYATLEAPTTWAVCGFVRLAPMMLPRGPTSNCEEHGCPSSLQDLTHPLPLQASEQRSSPASRPAVPLIERILGKSPDQICS